MWQVVLFDFLGRCVRQLAPDGRVVPMPPLPTEQNIPEVLGPETFESNTDGGLQVLALIKYVVDNRLRLGRIRDFDFSPVLQSVRGDAMRFRCMIVQDLIEIRRGGAARAVALHRQRQEEDAQEAGGPGMEELLREFWSVEKCA